MQRILVLIQGAPNMRTTIYGSVAVAGALILTLSCGVLEEQRNPYRNPDNSDVSISIANGGSDTVKIFSTFTISLDGILLDNVDSLKLSAPGNRLWSHADSLITSDKFATLKVALYEVSYKDTGMHAITLVGYLGNGQTISKSSDLYGMSPLNQTNIAGKIGEPITLQTPPVDDDVLYIWDISSLTRIVTDTPATQISFDGAFTAATGELYVKSGAARSPGHAFVITLKDYEAPIILCENASLVGKNIYSGNSSFYFRAAVYDRESDIKSVSLNGAPFVCDTAAADTFRCTAEFRGLDTLGGDDSLTIVVNASDNQLNAATDTFWLHYDAGTIVVDSPKIVLSEPAEDTTTIQGEAVTLLGTMRNIEIYDSVHLFYMVNNVPVASPVVLTRDISDFQLRIALSENVSKVKLYALPSRSTSDTIASQSITVIKDVQVEDTIPPNIKNITIEGEPISSNHISNRKNSLCEMTILDNGVGIATVTIAGTTVNEAGPSVYQTTLDIPHDTAFAVTVVALDMDNNRADTTFKVMYNQYPIFTTAPKDAYLIAGEAYAADISARDDDGDDVQIWARIQITRAQRDTIISLDASKKLVWTPTLSDTGKVNITLFASDGFQTAEYSYTVSVAKPAPVVVDSVKFLTTLSDFPDTLIFGEEPLDIFLSIVSSGEFFFNARVLGTNAILVDNSIDPHLVWRPTIQDTGLHTLEIIASVGNVADTLKPQIRVLPPQKNITLHFDRASDSLFEDGGVCSLYIKMSDTFYDTIRIGYGLDGNLTTAQSEDYHLAQPMVAFVPPGNTEAMIEIPVVNDTLDENDEVLVLQILGTTYNTKVVYPEKFSLRILDNDTSITPPPDIHINLAMTDSSGGEGNYTVTLPVYLNVSAHQAVRARVVSGGNAERYLDYTVNPAILNFDVGDSVKSISLNIKSDNVCEQHDTITLILRDPAGGEIGADSIFTYVITPSDQNSCRTRILYLRNNGALEDIDQEIIDSIKTWGQYEIQTVAQDKFISEYDAKSRPIPPADVIFISQTADDERIGKILHDVKIPIFCADSDNWQTLGLVEGVGAEWGRNLWIYIDDNGSDDSLLVRITSTFTDLPWGSPGLEADWSGWSVVDPYRGMIFWYQPGIKMADGTVAPEMRMAFIMIEGTHKFGPTYTNTWWILLNGYLAELVHLSGIGTQTTITPALEKAGTEFSAISSFRK
ncbi:MAG: hypothetical protein GF398_03515 [Chitinivibrionales bacterium]|nr:hypothetical protein [Chitinivibrionales bacterium]